MTTKGGPRPEAAPYNPAERVREFLEWLDRYGMNVFLTTMLPPIDHQSLIAARAEAQRVATSIGRIDDFLRYRREVIDKALRIYRRYGLYPIYFMGHSAPANVKVEAVEVLTDAMAGYLLADVLSEQASATLFARLDVILGGQIFPLGAEPS